MAEHTSGKLRFDEWGAVLTATGKRLIVDGVAIPAGGGDFSEAKANAARLVTAWNTHDDLYAACEAIDKFLTQKVAEGDRMVSLSERLTLIGGGYTHQLVKAAMAKAKGVGRAD